MLLPSQRPKRPEMPGAGVSNGRRFFRTRDFRISHHLSYESGAVVPLSGSDQAEPPRQNSRQVSAAKSIPDKSLNKAPKPALTSLRGSSSEKIRFSNA